MTVLKPVEQQVYDLVKKLCSSNGLVVFDVKNNADHKFIVENINSTIRVNLSQSENIVVSTKTVKGADGLNVTIPTQAKRTDFKKTSKSSVQPILSYKKPHFYNQLLSNFLCAKEWDKYVSRNILLYGPAGCVVKDTKIKVRMVSKDGLIPIKENKS